MHLRPRPECFRLSTRAGPEWIRASGPLSNWQHQSLRDRRRWQSKLTLGHPPSMKRRCTSEMLENFKYFHVTFFITSTTSTCNCTTTSNIFFADFTLTSSTSDSSVTVRSHVIRHGREQPRGPRVRAESISVRRVTMVTAVTASLASPAWRRWRWPAHLRRFFCFCFFFCKKCAKFQNTCYVWKFAP